MFRGLYRLGTTGKISKPVPYRDLTDNTSNLARREGGKAILEQQICNLQCNIILGFTMSVNFGNL